MHDVFVFNPSTKYKMDYVLSPKIDYIIDGRIYERQYVDCKKVIRTGGKLLEKTITIKVKLM